MSEALYLHDPDGHGIEVYVDRPPTAWRRSGRELMIATDPLDVDALLRTAGEEAWSGMPVGTVIGHVHLRVGNRDEAAAFFSEALGFDRITWSYPGALFLGAGGYHPIWGSIRGQDPELAPRMTPPHVFSNGRPSYPTPGASRQSEHSSRRRAMP